MSAVEEDPEPPLSEQTRRPLDTALRQQRMKAWYPMLNTWWVVGAFCLLGAVFVPVGELSSAIGCTESCPISTFVFLSFRSCCVL